jgi:hypothetical protein
MAAWILIRTGIPNAYPDTGGLKKKGKEGREKTHPKGR